MNADRSTLVIGCARGIGRSIAREFSRAGHVVHLIDRDPEAENVLREIEASGGKAHFYRADITQTEEFQKQLLEISKKGLDGAIYVASHRKKVDFLNTSREDWTKTFDVTLDGVFFTAQTLFPRLRKDHAFFVTVSSVAAQVVGHDTVAYHCAKAGLEQLTRYLAVKGGDYGVRVNGVRPGFIVVDEHRDKFFSEKNREYRKLAEKCHPLREIGASEDVSEAVLFLSSSRAKFINGQVLAIDGGFTLQDSFSLLNEPKSL